MKKIFLSIFLLTVLNSFAQEKTYFDMPFGAGGGYSPGWFIPKFEKINEKISQFGTPQLSSSGYYLSGGTGFVYIGFIPNLRLGGIAFTGETSEKGIKDGYSREVKYSNSFGGFTIEYTLPVIKNVGVSIGAIIGGGETKLEIFRNKNTYSWDNLWGEISDSTSSGNMSRLLKNDYILIAPTLNFDIPIYRFFGLRIGAGYSFALGNDWKADNELEIFNVPEEIAPSGFFFQSGLFIGFFSY